MNGRPTVWGYLLLLGWAVVGAAALPGWGAGWVLATVLAVALAAGFPFRAVGRGLLWMAPLAALPLLLGWAAGAPEALVVGGQVALRAAALMAAVYLVSRSVSVADLAALLEGVGARGLGFALGVAFNLLPTVQETARSTFHALRLRGGLRRPGLRTVRLLLVTLVVGTLRHGEEIVAAAEARAFHPARPTVRAAPRPALGDAWMAGLALAATAAALVC
ncbi:MAG: hypothetical protein GX605_01200 [Chloroflexi bacterium]|nr:hypothetical protein [Chloroflexota bacterium]